MNKDDFEEKYRKWQKEVQRRSEDSARRREQRNDIAIKFGLIFLVLITLVDLIIRLIF